MGGPGNAHHAVLIAACDAGTTSFLVFSRMAEEKRATMLLKLRKMGAGRMEINAGHVRRGIQFLVNIGTPLVVGALRGESQTALAAVVVGMAFGFADSDGPLLSRLSTSHPVPLLRNAATALRKGTARDRIDGRVNGGAVGIAGRLVR